jgi:hypothetical protein
LVFLKNIRRLEFWWRGVSEEGFDLYWSVDCEMKDRWTEEVAEHNTPLENLRSQELLITYSKPTSSPSPVVAKWVIVSGYIRRPALPRNIPYGEKLKSGLPTTKEEGIPDIAMATSESLTTFMQSGWYYNSLPMPASTGLPVHCHGQFSTTVDRRSLRIDGDSGQWNTFLAEQCLPYLYFFLLERLAIRPQWHSRYYSFWPAVRANETISYALQSEFWKKLPDCPRPIITTQQKNQCQVSEIIFDTREKRLWKAPSDPIAEFVKIMLPDSYIVYRPALNLALFTSDRASTERKVHPNLRQLTPLFVRTQLQLPEAATALAKFDDGAVRSIIDFTLEEGPADNLIGCYGLRTSSRAIQKFDRLQPPNEEIVANIVDEIGFELFKNTHGDSLIKPCFLSDKTSKILEQDQRLNIRRLGGRDIDRFVGQIIPNNEIMLLSAQTKKWLTKLWDYIFKMGFTVSFYKSRPTLPLLEPGETCHFASLNGLKNQPIMPSQMPSDLRRLYLQIPGMFRLAPINLDAVSTFTAEWDCDERFLQCLGLIVREDTPKLTMLLRTNVHQTDLKVVSLVLRLLTT